MFEKISNNYIELARDMVLNELRNAIFENKLKSGDRLIQSAIASDMGISRTPVREALRKLEQEGLAIGHPRKGCIVVGISIDDILEIYDLVEVLEGLAIRLACLNLSRIDINLLNEKIDLMEININKIDMFEQLYKDFSYIILKSANSKKLIENLDNMHEYIKYLRKNNLKDSGRRAIILDYYKRIMISIEKGNEILAEKYLRTYINNEKNHIIKKLS